MRVWMKGAIVGGVWGALSTPLYLLVAYVWGWERTMPEILKSLLAILLLPSKLVLLITFSPPSFVKIWLINLVGWALIGGGIGYLYQKYRG